MHEYESGHKTHSLAVPSFGIRHGIGMENVVQRGLTGVFQLRGEVRVGGEGPGEVRPNGVLVGGGLLKELLKGLRLWRWRKVRVHLPVLVDENRPHVPPTMGGNACSGKRERGVKELLYIHVIIYADGEARKEIPTKKCE